MIDTTIPNFLDRRPIIWSYSLLHCFDDICAHQGEARYINKTIKFVETPEIKYGNSVHTAFEHRVGGQKPLPLDMQKWEGFAKPFDNRGAKTEQWFGITAEGSACESRSSNVWGRGKIDLNVINGQAAYIGDWKTGNPKYEDPFELEIGALFLKVKNPQITTVKGQFFWLREDRAGVIHDLSNFQATWSKICSIMQTIENYRKVGDFPKRKTPLCGWCQRFDCDENTNPNKP